MFTVVEALIVGSLVELVVLAALAARRHAARLVELRDQLEPHGDVVAAVMAFQMGVLLAPWVATDGEKARVNTFSLAPAPLRTRQTRSRTRHPPGLAQLLETLDQLSHRIDYRSFDALSFQRACTLLSDSPHHSSLEVPLKNTRPSHEKETYRRLSNIASGD